MNMADKLDEYEDFLMDTNHPSAGSSEFGTGVKSGDIQQWPQLRLDRSVKYRYRLVNG